VAKNAARIGLNGRKSLRRLELSNSEVVAPEEEEEETEREEEEGEEAGEEEED
jgi:hypothetical protein